MCISRKNCAVNAVDASFVVMAIKIVQFVLSSVREERKESEHAERHVQHQEKRFDRYCFIRSVWRVCLAIEANCSRGHD